MKPLDQFRQDIMSGPDLFAHKIDLAAELLLLVRLSRNVFAEASFLDDRIINPQVQGNWYRLASIEATLAGCAGARPVHFIFHAGHVGSTLLSRLIEQAGNVLTLREPLPMRTLAELQDDLDCSPALFSEAAVDRMAQMQLLLWSRGYSDTQAVVVKATSAAARVAPRLLSLAPDARAIYLHLSAEPYLATLLAGKDSPIDLRGMAKERYRRLERLVGGAELGPLYALSLGELAAMTWCVELLTRRRICETTPERLLCLDFEVLLSNPAPMLAAVFTHLRLSAPDGYLENIDQAPVWSRYAKAPEAAYSTQTRAEILQQSRMRYGDEIRKGLVWIDRLAKNAPLAAPAFCGLLPP
ncbi:MAG: hypothetical protein ABL883_06630 [Terricaulis sp.]